MQTAIYSVLITAAALMAGMIRPVSGQGGSATATFAGGCFWCMEPPFEKLPGVAGVVSGYAGGSGEGPTYYNYSEKGYVEAVQVTYDPEKISYPELLDVYWRQVNPTDSEGQFCDRGPQYRPLIYYHNRQQKKAAEESKQALAKSRRYDKPLTIEIVPFSAFYPAEEYHQDYHKKNPWLYKIYRWNCGRDRDLRKIWEEAMSPKIPAAKCGGEYSKPSEEELKKMLTPLQYNVTQKAETESAFRNEYWDNKAEGIYVDVVSGEPIFSSTDKYDSHTGWPSFIRPLESGNIVEKPDRSFFTVRTEVRSRNSDSHLGHVFKDGPSPDGRRYCINSAALRFIPRADLEKEGYADYKELFAE